jgi:hypothetical protein
MRSPWYQVRVITHPWASWALTHVRDTGKFRGGSGIRCFRMRWVVAAAFPVWAICVVTAQAQRHPSPNNTFTSPDGTFRFDHLDVLVRCHRDSNQSGRWKPDDSCEPFIPFVSMLLVTPRKLSRAWPILLAI